VLATLLTSAEKLGGLMSMSLFNEQNFTNIIFFNI